MFIDSSKNIKFNSTSVTYTPFSNYSFNNSKITKYDLGSIDLPKNSIITKVYVYGRIGYSSTRGTCIIKKIKINNIELNYNTGFSDSSGYLSTYGVTQVILEDNCQYEYNKINHAIKANKVTLSEVEIQSNNQNAEYFGLSISVEYLTVD